MANINTNSVQTSAGRRLNVDREAELLQSFVRINVTDDDEDNSDADNTKDKPKETDTTVVVVNEKDKAEAADAAVPPGTNTENADQKAANPKAEPVTEVIKKKAKRRRRRTGPKHEELYCDKDRAAAVNLGSKDIKHSLRLKRKQDRSKALQIPEEAEPGTFLALGNYEMCRGDLNIAINFMTKALELNPTEKGALVARSKCYILLGQPENALKDAEMALQIDKTFLKAIYQKAEALYYLGDFEHSLMYYHRGLHIRPDHEGFKLGVYKAQKAIENAIGSRDCFSSILLATKSKSSASARSKDTEPSNNGNEENNNNNNSNLKTKSDLKSSQSSGGSSNTGSNAKLRINKGTKKDSKLLRELGQDKEYLDSLMNNPNIKCKFSENDNRIENCIRETVDFLNARQEFWRQQLPSKLK